MHCKKIKYLKRGILIVLLAVLLLLVIPIPFSREYGAKEIKVDDPSHIEDCRIRVSGYYHWNLLRDDTFSGKISVSGYRLTSEEMYQMHDVKLDGKYGDILEYSHRENGAEGGYPAATRYSLGLLFSDRLFHNMCILVYYDSALDRSGKAKTAGSGGVWNSADGCCIVASVGSREEALQKLYHFGVVNPPSK